MIHTRADLLMDEHRTIDDTARTMQRMLARRILTGREPARERVLMGNPVRVSAILWALV